VRIRAAFLPKRCRIISDCEDMITSRAVSPFILSATGFGCHGKLGGGRLCTCGKGRSTTLNYIRTTLLVLLAGVLAGCSLTARGPVPVKVTLSEMKIELSMTTFEVGVPYRFIVTNAGKVPHEMMLMPPSMDGKTMSTMPMTQLDTMALTHIHDSDLAPGAKWIVEYTFTRQNAGTLEVACYLPGHYDAGMYRAISVE
jgi:uncharacterized cupredoxin-like copper-binding protein